MPFAQEEELEAKEVRLALLNADLNIDGDGGFDVLNDTDNREEQPQRDEMWGDYDDAEEPDEPP